MCLLFCHLSEVPTAAGVTLNNVSSMYGVWHRKGNLSILLTQCPNSDLQATLSCMFSMLFCSTTPNLAQHQPLRRHFQWCSLKPGVFKHAGQCTLRAKAVCPPPHGDFAVFPQLPSQETLLSHVDQWVVLQLMDWQFKPQLYRVSLDKTLQLTQPQTWSPVFNYRTLHM